MFTASLMSWQRHFLQIFFPFDSITKHKLLGDRFVVNENFTAARSLVSWVNMWLSSKVRLDRKNGSCDFSRVSCDDGLSDALARIIWATFLAISMPLYRLSLKRVDVEMFVSHFYFVFGNKNNQEKKTLRINWHFTEESENHWNWFG